MSRTSANLLLLLAGALWGLGFIAQATAMDSLGPVTFVGMRFVLATLCVLPLMLRENKGKAPLTRQDLAMMVLIGSLMFAGLATQQIALVDIPVSNSGFLTALYVVLTPLLALFLFRESVHWSIWPAVVLSLTGIWLLSGGGNMSLSTGEWLTILCAVFWSLQMCLVSRSVVKLGRPILVAFVQFCCCALFGLSLGLTFEPITMAGFQETLPEIIYAGTISGGFCFTILIIAQRYTGSSAAALLLSTEALFAAIFAYLILSERLTGPQIFGASLIFIAVLLVQFLPELYKRRRKMTLSVNKNA